MSTAARSHFAAFWASYSDDQVPREIVGHDHRIGEFEAGVWLGTDALGRLVGDLNALCKHATLSFALAVGEVDLARSALDQLETLDDPIADVTREAARMAVEALRGHPQACDGSRANDRDDRRRDPRMGRRVVMKTP